MQCYSNIFGIYNCHIQLFMMMFLNQFFGIHCNTPTQKLISKRLRSNTHGYLSVYTSLIMSYAMLFKFGIGRVFNLGIGREFKHEQGNEQENNDLNRE
jgi:hypothetical protein